MQEQYIGDLLVGKKKGSVPLLINTSPARELLQCKQDTLSWTEISCGISVNNKKKKKTTFVAELLMQV